ncbi:MAG: efflux RND transporter periplasmic adaptor subunit [Ktedonobacteraceae bacterium]|nr:efflux RND transporter periplasmic adaptor subunit [Ktedonobacteraceae bacterium]
MRRLILVPLMLIIAVMAIGGGIAYYLYQNYLFYSTDDAQISGAIVSVSSPGNGKLDSLSANIGDKVSTGETIATISTTDPTTGTRKSINVSSPISGVILQLPVVQGQSVAAGLALAQVTDLSEVHITAYVEEGSISNIKAGQEVDITVDAYSDTTFSGHVQQIVQATAGSFSLLPTQDNASGNFTKVGQRIPVIITLDGAPSKTVMPGMSASVKIHIH